MTTTIVSWNVNGLRQRHRMNQFMQVFHHNPEIVCIQETKTARDKIPGDIKKIYGYHSFFYPMNNGDISEVALYSREEPRSVHFGLGGSPFDKEGRIVTADFGSFVLMNVYVPLGIEPADNPEHKIAFFDALLAYVKTFSEEKRPVIIGGDFGVAHTSLDVFSLWKNPLKQTGVTGGERKKIDELITFGYFDTFRMFTRGTGHFSWWPNGFLSSVRNRGRRLDYFFANECARPFVKNSEILSHIEGSDHCPIRLELEFQS
jgi:exodeoxyribonuclease-3